MVTRREAELAKTLRDVLALSTYQNGLDNADPTDLRDDMEAIHEAARAALKIKARPTRRRVVLELGPDVPLSAVTLRWQDRGTRVTVRDAEGDEKVYHTSVKRPKGPHPDPSECMTGGACPDCAARDELARRTYGKAFDELPDDGPEQDYVVAALEGK